MTIRLAPQIPVHCAGCFNQQQIPHVDFDAALDRGYGNEEAIKISMDEAIFCANCVREGAELLGMTDSQGLKAELEDTRRKLDVQRKLKEQAQRYADTMEEALGHRPEPVRIDHRKRPRQIREDVVA